jgi:hypothetical protein
MPEPSTAARPGDARKEQPMNTSIGDIASNFGRGLFAGAAGTAVMTVSSTIEMKLSGRGASQTPAQAAEKVLEVEPEDEGGKRRASRRFGSATTSTRGPRSRATRPLCGR